MTSEPLPYDMEALVFIPAGDGAPAQSKRLGDVNHAEFVRWAKAEDIAEAQQRTRFDRLRALLAEAKRRMIARGAVRLGEVMSQVEMEEMVMLQAAIDACMRALDKGPFRERPE